MKICVNDSNSCRTHYCNSGGIFMTFFGSFKTKTICRKLLAAVFLVTGLFLCFPQTLQAADFKHNHTAACYSRQLAPCKAQHRQSSQNDTTTAHCGTCNASTTQTVTVYWYHCFGIGEDMETGGKRVCGSCGSQTYEWGMNGGGSHEVLQDVLTCGKTGTAVGRLWLTNLTPDWTKGGVTLEAGIRILGSLTLPGEPYSWDQKASWTAETKYTAEENGTYTVYGRDKEGRIVKETIDVRNIDRTGPSLTETVQTPTDWTRETVVVSWKAEDLQPDKSAGCGMAASPCSVDGGQSFTDQNTLTVSENGTVELLLQDLLGNQTMHRIPVTNIDRTAPEIQSLEIQEKDWQREAVTVQLKAEDLQPDGSAGCGLHETAYSLDGEAWQQESCFRITENGTYTFRVRDRLENSVERKLSISRIDRTAPVICSIQPDTSVTLKKEKILVRIRAEDLQPDGSRGSGLHETAYSLDGGQTWQKEDYFYVEAGKSYQVRVRDALSWESESRIVKRADFPFPEPSPVPDDPTPDPQPVPEPKPTPDPKPTPTPQPDKPEPEKPEPGTPQFPEGQPEAGDADENPDSTVSGADHKESGQGTEKEALSPGKVPEKKLLETGKKTDPVKTVLRVAAISAAVLALLGLLGFLVALYLFSLPVYWLEKDGEGGQAEHFLGKVLLHKENQGYYVHLSSGLLQGARTSSYRIRVSGLLLKQLKNSRILLECEEQSREAVVQETIDFTL